MAFTGNNEANVKKQTNCIPSNVNVTFTDFRDDRLVSPGWVFLRTVAEALPLLSAQWRQMN
jgi:hypothetical protein